MLGNLLLGLLLAALLMASISFLGLIHLPIYILQALFKAKSDPKFLKKILLTYPLIFTATFFLLHSTSYALSACLIVLLIKSIATLVSILILPAQVKYAADSTPYGKSFLQFLYNYKYILIITTCFAAITFHALPFCICSGIISSIYIYMLCTAAAADQETIIDSSIEISSTQENSNICIYVPGNLFPYGTASEITTPFQMQEVRFPNTDHPTRCSEVAATLEDCLQAYRKVRSEAVTANNQVIAYGKSLGGMIIAMAESDLAMDKQLPIFTNCSPNTIAAIVACWLVALKAPQKTSSSFGYSGFLLKTFTAIFTPFLWLCGWHRTTDLFHNKIIAANKGHHVAIKNDSTVPLEASLLENHVPTLPSEIIVANPDHIADDDNLSGKFPAPQ